jgi:hypothetical protein
MAAAVVVSVGLFSWGWANDDAPAEKTADGKEPASSAADQTAVERALLQPAELDFVETPLKDVAASISKKTGVNVMLDNKAITDAGGAEDTPITFQMKGISLKSALRHMLTEHELNFIVDPDNVLLITSDTKTKEHVVTRVYDAHDLTAPVRKFTESQINLDSLVDLITSNVAPTTWSIAGGTGSIVPFGAQVVVTQTPEIHEQIADLFAGLRDVRDTPRKVIDAGGRLGLLRGPGANILGHLQKRVDLQFQETPLKDVIAALAIGQPGLAIVLDVKSITDAGGSPDLPIIFKAKQMRFDTALRLMLQDHELNYIVDHEVLAITSDVKAKEHVVIDYYPVGDLIDASQTSSKEIADAYDKLQELITTTVAPTTWATAGGSGSLTLFPPCQALVCSQTGEIHAEVTALLAKLRAGRGKETAAAAPALATRIYELASDHADAAGDYVNVIRSLIEPQSWRSRDVYLGKVPGAIIARCSPATHERIELLLDELQALPRPPLGPTKSGGGVPVVGGLGGGGRGGAF